jgi:dipeptidyl aminopeptidase/acylaminoacyl peptidase
MTIDRRALMSGSAGLLTTAAFPALAQVPSARPPLDLFTTPPLIDAVALSPDGKRIAFITQLNDIHALGYYDVADRKITTVRLGPDKVRGLMWADNTHVVVTASTTASAAAFAGDRHEFSRAVVINLATDKTETLYAGREGFYSMIVGEPVRIKPADGAYRVAAINYSFSGDRAVLLCSFGLDANDMHEIMRAREDMTGNVVTPEGLALAYDSYDKAGREWSLYVNQVGDPKAVAQFKKVYSLSQPPRIPVLAGLGRDARSVLIVTRDDEGDGSDYQEIALDGTPGETLDAAHRDHARAPIFHPTTRCLIGFSRNDGDAFAHEIFDPLIRRLVEGVPQVVGADGRFRFVDLAEDPRKLIVHTEGAKDSGTYIFIDFSTGDSSTIAFDYPDLKTEWMAPRQAIDYTAADGTPIHAYLTLPPGRETAKGLPLVVIPHGGPEARDYLAFDWWAQAVAASGYAVLQPNFRGSTGYGLKFVEAGHGEWGRKMQTDLSDGVRDLVRRGIVDPKRVAIFGASYGGYAALAGATLDHGIYNCAVSIAGPSDLKSLLVFEAENTSENSSTVKYWKTFIGNPAHYDEISPCAQAAKADCPILLIHGTDDTVVPIDQSQRMEKALTEAGKTVKLITYPGQDHWESVASARVAMMKAAMDFIAQYNPV